MSKHWAICNSVASPDYIRGDEAATPEQAEQIWRDRTGLYFMEVEVRRTTAEEDERLSDD